MDARSQVNTAMYPSLEAMSLNLAEIRGNILRTRAAIRTMDQAMARGATCDVERWRVVLLGMIRFERVLAACLEDPTYEALRAVRDAGPVLSRTLAEAGMGEG